MTISADAEEAFNKMQHSSMMKGLNRLGYNMIKAVCGRRAGHIILSGENLTGFSLRVETRQGCQLSSLLLNIVLEVPDRAMRQDQEIKGLQTGKKEAQLLLLTDDMMLYTKNSKEPIKKNVGINKFSKLASYEINLQKSDLR